jgi:hypothetical protein
MTHPFRRSPVDTDQNILLSLRERLRQIERRLIDLQDRVDALRPTAADRSMTLREFTEKQLNGKRPDDQETYASYPRTAAEKYTTG